MSHVLNFMICIKIIASSYADEKAGLWFTLNNYGHRSEPKMQLRCWFEGVAVWRWQEDPGILKRGYQENISEELC